MNRSIFLALLLVSTGSLNPSLAAESPAEVQPAAEQAQPAEAATKKREPSNCIKETGTHIRPRDGECVAIPGKVLSREDLERSGDTTEAIRRALPGSR